MYALFSYKYQLIIHNFSFQLTFSLSLSYFFSCSIILWEKYDKHSLSIFLCYKFSFSCHIFCITSTNILQHHFSNKARLNSHIRLTPKPPSSLLKQILFHPIQDIFLISPLPLQKNE